MDDLEHHSGKKLISDLAASIVIVVILAVFSISFMIWGFVKGFFIEFRQNEPKISIGIFVGYWLLVFLVSFFSIRNGWRNKKKEEKEKEARELRLFMFRSEELPILFTTINNQMGEYKKYTCSICYETIGNNLNIVACPECKFIFHLNHLLKWAEDNDKCPVCQFKIKK
jgi:hypothetical protein